MNDIIKIIEALENSGILLKELLKHLKMKLKNKLDTLGASLLGNLLTGVKGMMRAVEGIVRAGEGSVAS